MKMSKIFVLYAAILFSTTGMWASVPIIVATPGHMRAAMNLVTEAQDLIKKGDIAGAIRELTTAEGMLPPNWTFTVALVPPHVPIWFDLATAHLAAHHDAEAAARLQKIVGGGTLRAYHPVVYIRSLFLLGEISDRQGDGAKAADYYRRYLHYWDNSEIDRDNVATARRKLGDR